MKIPANARSLFDMYLFHHITSHYNRAELKKKVTKYNRANKTERISTGMLIKERFPTLFKYVQSLYPTTPEEDLFENNFNKLMTNLHILPSKRTLTRSYNNQQYYVYKTLEPSLICDAYQKHPTQVINIITNKIYNINGSRFESTDGEDVFSTYDVPNYLAVVREI